MVFQSVILVFFLLHFVASFLIIWDKNADLVNFNDIDFARGEEVRMPNWLFIYPGIHIAMHFYKKLTFLFTFLQKGTKWCGAGNIADDYDDLGEFRFTDKCCREHDHCKDIIEGYQTMHNLTNNRFYSK